MADKNRKSDKKQTETPKPKADKPVELSPEALRKISGGASVPPPSPQPSEGRVK